MTDPGVADHAATIGGEQHCELARNQTAEMRVLAPLRHIHGEAAQHHLLGVEAAALADDLEARQKFLGPRRGDQVIIRAGLDRALHEGTSGCAHGDESRPSRAEARDLAHQVDALLAGTFDGHEGDRHLADRTRLLGGCCQCLGGRFRNPHEHSVTGQD